MERYRFATIFAGRALLSDPGWGKKIRTRDEASMHDFTQEALAELYWLGVEA